MIFSNALLKNIRRGQKLEPEEAMQLAIREARKGLGLVSPNPPVGCVIVDKDHRLLSTGYHKKYGQSHAETEALKKIKNKKLLQNAFLYVTLEPCAQKGKTPPCVQTLLKYPLKAVIYGDRDPNPHTNGKSLKLLKQKGLIVRKFSFFKEDIQKLLEVFSFNIKYQKTFVRAESGRLAGRHDSLQQRKKSLDYRQKSQTLCLLFKRLL